MGALDTPIALDVLQTTAALLLTAKQGEKGQIVADAAERLQVSKQAIYAGLNRLRLPRRVVRAGVIAPVGRKRRSDAGCSALSHDEARRISGYLRESNRATGKVLADIEAAVETLRSNGEIVAGRVDEETGEFLPLSTSAVAKALRAYGCHPGQLSAPSPKLALSSPHPNYCVQIDPSLCVLYYLRGEQGLQTMPRDEFYKNKPKNLERILNDRVWRYVFVDHASGAFYVEYVLGAESGANLCHTFINAMQPRGLNDPFCGVPMYVMLDPGSANTGAMFHALCAALGVVVWINKPKQPWAKGSVEKHNDIIEREFEHRLRYHKVNSLEELNAAAWRWMRSYQSTQVMSRHGMTRYDAWMRITPQQLRLPPAADVCRRLANHAPEERTVSVQLRVSYRGKRYDVSRVPGVVVDQKLQVARNAWQEDSVHILGHDSEGRPAFFVAPLVERDEWGFEGAVQLGEYRSLPQTRSDIERREVERVVMDATSDEEAAAKRKAKALPFGGRIDPYKAITDRPEPSYIPRRGTPTQVDAPAVIEPQPAGRAPLPEYVPQRLTHGGMARELKQRVESLGGEWSAALYAQMAERWPEGVTEDQLDGCATALLRGGLRLVSGGAS